MLRQPDFQTKAFRSTSKAALRGALALQKALKKDDRNNRKLAANLSPPTKKKYTPVANSKWFLIIIYFAQFPNIRISLSQNQSKRRRRKRAALRQPPAIPSTNESAPRQWAATRRGQALSTTRISLTTVRTVLCYRAARTHRRHQPAAAAATTIVCNPIARFAVHTTSTISWYRTALPRPLAWKCWSAKRFPLQSNYRILYLRAVCVCVHITNRILVVIGGGAPWTMIPNNHRQKMYQTIQLHHWNQLQWRYVIRFAFFFFKQISLISKWWWTHFQPNSLEDGIF